jgi:hypothetical protein
MKYPLKYKGRISISRPQGGRWDDEISITIQDENSLARFLDIKITAKDLMLALTNRADVEMSFDVRALDNVGKHRILKEIEFEIGNIDYSNRQDIAHRQALAECRGTIWIPSSYFGAQNSFFERDGKKYARTDAHAYLTDEQYAAHKAGKFATEGED